MKLLIDFGNSRCKWVQLVDGGLQNFKAHAYSSDDAMLRACEVSQCLPLDKVDEVHAISVLGEEFENAFQQQLETKFSRRAIFYIPQANQFGVKLAYSNPLSYGVDRYAALVAVHHQYEGVKLVVDCGTAVTMDVIKANGQHLGGLILPGLDLMCSSLSGKASGIPECSANQQAALLNDYTVNAVYSGCALTLQHGLNGIIQDIKRNIQQEITLCATGGGSDMIKNSEMQYIDCPNLVLEGLQIMQSA